MPTAGLPLRFGVMISGRLIGGIPALGPGRRRLISSRHCAEVREWLCNRVARPRVPCRRIRGGLFNPRYYVLDRRTETRSPAGNGSGRADWQDTSVHHLERIPGALNDFVSDLRPLKVEVQSHDRMNKRPDSRTAREER